MSGYEQDDSDVFFLGFSYYTILSRNRLNLCWIETTINLIPKNKT